MVTLTIYPDTIRTQRAAVQALENLFTENVNRPVLFLTSGGSCHEITGLLPDTICDPRVTLSVLDERFTSDPALNNFLQLSGTRFFKGAMIRGARAIDSVPGVNETIEQLSRRMESGFKSWRQNNRAGIIIALMGIGRDGHTAGIMRYPDDERLFDSLFVHTGAWVVGYDAGSRNPIPLRVTVTVPYIRDIGHTVVYVSGPEKKQALRDVMAPRGLPYQTPARILHTMKHCLLFTDQTVDKVETDR